MGLDLSRADDHKPLLGRGRIPEEVKRRLRGDKTEPEDEKIARLHARTRRLVREGKSLDDELSKSLNEIGGKWESPETWQPRSHSQRQAWERYNQRLRDEEAVSPQAAYLASLVRKEFTKKFTRGVAGVADNINVTRDEPRQITTISWGTRRFEVTDETLHYLDTALDTEHMQVYAMEIADRLASQP